MIFSIRLNLLPTFCWSRILLLYSLQIRRNKIRTTVVASHVRLLLGLIIELELALGLLRTRKHVRWNQLAPWVLVATQVHGAEMSLCSSLCESIDANGVIAALVYLPFIATSYQSSTVPAVTRGNITMVSFGRSQAWSNLVSIGLVHSELTYVVSLGTWTWVLSGIITGVCVNIATFVVVAEGFYVWRSLLSLDEILIC